MDHPQKDILLKMHQFYAEEARHQRSMMWETVKWFTPVLLAIHGAWGLIYMNTSLGLSKQEVYALLLFVSIGGMIFSYICIGILGNFYRTNFIYISMFAKIEDELDFDTEERKRSTYFSKDRNITYHRWIRDRSRNFDSSEDFIRSGQKHHPMYIWMSGVFFLFLVSFAIELIAITYKAIGGTSMYTILGVSSIALGLLGAYLTAFGLRVRPQYSDDLIKELESKNKDLVVITDVRQRKRLIWWGLACFSLAALIQFCLLVVPRAQ